MFGKNIFSDNNREILHRLKHVHLRKIITSPNFPKGPNRFFKLFNSPQPDQHYCRHYQLENGKLHRLRLSTSYADYLSNTKGLLHSHVQEVDADIPWCHWWSDWLVKSIRNSIINFLLMLFNIINFIVKYFYLWQKSVFEMLAYDILYDNNNNELLR